MHLVATTEIFGGGPACTCIALSYPPMYTVSGTFRGFKARHTLCYLKGTHGQHGSARMKKGPCRVQFPRASSTDETLTQRIALRDVQSYCILCSANIIY